MRNIKAERMMRSLEPFETRLIRRLVDAVKAREDMLSCHQTKGTPSRRLIERLRAAEFAVVDGDKYLRRKERRRKPSRSVLYVVFNHDAEQIAFLKKEEADEAITYLEKDSDDHSYWHIRLVAFAQDY